MLKKLRFLIASGPTREPLDPVRYLSNYSTGVMGRHLASSARKAGHRVTLVEAPKDAETAQDLKVLLSRFLPGHDILMMAAAVCDVRPAKVSKSKIKKNALQSIPVVKNPDILAELAKKKRKGQIFIGFGLETKGILKNGRKKLKNKSLELIVLQQVTKKILPFGEKNIQAWVLKKTGEMTRFKSISKKRLSLYLVREAAKLFSS